jgi:hypothetical protein
MAHRYIGYEPSKVIPGRNNGFNLYGERKSNSLFYR